MIYRKHPIRSLLTSMLRKASILYPIIPPLVERGRAPDKLCICVFYAMKTSKNACIIRSECTHYAYILLCKQTYQIRKLHLFVILTAIGWFIVNIQSDLFWHRCLERQAFCTPQMYTFSPSKSIKGSNYGEFLKDKNVLLCKMQFT
jgi:hypothetical protein